MTAWIYSESLYVPCRRSAVLRENKKETIGCYASCLSMLYRCAYCLLHELAMPAWSSLPLSLPLSLSPSLPLSPSLSLPLAPPIRRIPKPTHQQRHMEMLSSFLLLLPHHKPYLNLGEEGVHAAGLEIRGCGERQGTVLVAGRVERRVQRGCGGGRGCPVGDAAVGVGGAGEL